MKEEQYYLGKILKTFGNDGRVMVHLDVDDPSEYLEMESVFLDLHGERIPFFIESVELRNNNKAVIAFEDFKTADDAESLTGLEMYLPAAVLPLLEGNNFYYHEIIGFLVIDEHYGEIGFISDVLDLPHQSLFQIYKGDTEILIPVVDEIITEVDREHKTLHIAAPDGLIDIYLH